jgi:hypothetical protein
MSVSRKEDAMRRIHGIRISVLAIMVAGALFSQVAAAEPTGHQSVTGTICRVDTRTGSIDLLTAVGHVVRIRRVNYAPGAGVKVTSGRVEVGMAALVPGTVCRIECDVAPSGSTATGVLVLQPAPGGSQ